MPFELKPLPFAIDALAPHISKETLEFHHGKHHKAYVTKLNELSKGTEFENMSLVDIVRKSSGTLFNNAAQVWNHDFYWNSLKPGGSKPSDALAKALDTSFGSFAEFEKQFKASATTKFASGWTWLVRSKDGKLAIKNSNDADNPLRWDETPLITCDVWEHAYYVDYRNERPRYVDGFWQVANWEFAAKNLG
jgi:superoxide dismutase, Fe-Mn family